MYCSVHTVRIYGNCTIYVKQVRLIRKI